MVPVTIVINVPADLGTQWLGHNTLIERLLEKLVDVREADVLLLTDNLQRISEVLGSTWADQPDRRWASLGDFPRPSGQHGSCHPLLNLANAVHSKGDGEDRGYLVLNPLFPFLSQGWIDKALNGLLSGSIKLAVSSLITNQFCSITPMRQLSLAPVTVQAGLAVRAERLKDCNQHNVQLNGASDMLLVISQIEAVNVLDETGLNIAKALITYCQ